LSKGGTALRERKVRGDIGFFSCELQTSTWQRNLHPNPLPGNRFL
jgi:hypothetical protein